MGGVGLGVGAAALAAQSLGTRLRGFAVVRGRRGERRKHPGGGQGEALWCCRRRGRGGSAGSSAGTCGAPVTRFVCRVVAEAVVVRRPLSRARVVGARGHAQHLLVGSPSQSGAIAPDRSSRLRGAKPQPLRKRQIAQRPYSYPVLLKRSPSTPGSMDSPCRPGAPYTLQSNTSGRDDETSLVIFIGPAPEFVGHRPICHTLGTLF